MIRTTKSVMAVRFPVTCPLAEGMITQTGRAYRDSPRVTTVLSISHGS